MLRKKQEVLLLDTRDRKAYEKFRIPGSMSIPLYAFKTKAFLRGKPLILVSEGYPNLALEQACKDARAEGFTTASILNGGLRSWTQKNGLTEGGALASYETGMLSPKDYLLNKDSPDWLLISVSDPSLPSLPGALHLPWDGSPSEFASALKGLIKERTGSQRPSVLLCDERGDKYHRIERAVQRAQISEVFYLKGGAESYRAFQHAQALLGQPGKEEVKRCVTCP
jgi:rhodanese-related sulfurtransferase